MVQRW